MSGDLVAPAEALVSLIESDVTFDDNGRARRFRAELWEPPILHPPCGTVAIPSNIRRTEPDGAESQLGANDWYAEYLVSLYFDFVKTQQVQQRMTESLVSFIAAVDADRSLSGTVFDAGIVNADPFTDETVTDRRRSLVGYQITVGVLLLVSTS